MFYDGTTLEGVHSSFRQVRLELDVDSVLFVLPLVVSHIITEGSPLWGMTQKEMARKKVEFVLVSKIKINFYHRYKYTVSTLYHLLWHPKASIHQNIHQENPQNK